MGKYIHLQLCKYYGIPTSTDNWYDHTPQPVVESGDITILWDVPIITDREIKCNRPDIVVKDRKTRTCQFIDVTIPFDRNILTKEREKLSKYSDLKMECRKMWNMDIEIVPIVIGATGVVHRGLLRYIDKLSGDIRFEMLQKIVLLGTAHILRKLLNYE